MLGLPEVGNADTRIAAAWGIAKHLHSNGCPFKCPFEYQMYMNSLWLTAAAAPRRSSSSSRSRSFRAS